MRSTIRVDHRPTFAVGNGLDGGIQHRLDQPRLGLMAILQIAPNAYAAALTVRLPKN